MTTAHVRTIDLDTALIREAKRIITLYHPDLAAAEVTVNVLMSRRALKTATATKINPPRDRAQGMADATITIDHMRWDAASEPEREAMLDQALARLAVQKTEKRDADGKVVMSGGEPELTAKLDDFDRPKLKARKPDHVIEVFEAVAERHGQAAPEAMALRELADSAAGEQLGLAFRAPAALAATGTDGGSRLERVARGLKVAREAEGEILDEIVGTIRSLPAKPVSGSPRARGGR